MLRTVQIPLLSTLAVAIVLVAAAPPAAAAVLFSEDFEGGVAGWSWPANAGNVVRDCNVGSPGCGARWDLYCCAVYLQATRSSDVALAGTLRFTFDYRGTALGGNTDSDVRLYFDNGQGIMMTPTESGTHGNNGMSLGTFQNGWEHRNFATWPSTHTWYRGELTLDADARTATMKAFAADGTLLGSSGSVSWSSTATRITQVFFATVNWGGPTETFWFDSIRIERLTPPSAPGIGTATPGAGQITVTWSAPSDNGGSPVTSYTLYRGAPGSETAYKTGLAGTSYADTGLSAGATFSYRVAAVSAVGTGSLSGAVSATTWTAPGAPTGLSATPGAKQIALSWTAPSNVGGSGASLSSYTLYRGPAGSETVYRTGLTGTSYTDSSLPDGTTYSYKVAAVNAAGTGAASGAASATTWTAPGAPTGLTATPGAKLVALAWSAPSNVGGSGASLSSYTLYRGPAGSETVYRTGLTGTSYTDSSLPDGTTYSYRIAAVNAVGTGALSGAASATTWTVPGAPTGLAATPGVKQIALSWTAPGDVGGNGASISSYTIYRGATPGSETSYRTGVAGTSFTDPSLGDGATFSYRVAAVNGVGTGALAPATSATTWTVPGAPTGLAATPGVGQIALSWSAPANVGGAGASISSYTLYRGASPGSETSYRTGLTGTSFTDVSLGDGASFSYRVAAVNAVGTGAASAGAGATTWTVPGAPTGLAATPGVGKIVLSWTAPAHVGGVGASLTSYTVYRGTEPGSLASHATGLSSATFTDDGLGEGATFHYAIAARNAVGEGARSAEASAATWTVPGAPTGLVATPGLREIALSWQAPANVGGVGASIASYAVYDSAGALVQGGVAGTSWVHAGLANGEERAYRVAALNAVGEGARSEVASARAWDVPGAPLAIGATGGVREIALEWDAPATDGGTPVTGYRVYRGADASSLALHAALAADAFTFLDAGLQNDETLHYAIRAVNAAGEGPAGSASATTFALPGAPTALVAAAGPGVGEVSLSWEAPSFDGRTPVTGYAVWKDGEAIGTIGPSLSHVVTGLANGATHAFAVAAVNAAGEGERSASASATTFDLPTAPATLAAEGGLHRVTLSWSPPESDGGTPVSRYRVYGGDAGSPLALLAELGAEATTFVDGGLGNGVTRAYVVAATNLVGEGPASAEASARTAIPPSAPLDVAAAAGEALGEIRLSWSAPADEGGTPLVAYRVYLVGPDGKSTLHAVVEPTATGFVATDQPLLEQRTFAVSAENGAGEGPLSESACSMPFPTPFPTIGGEPCPLPRVPPELPPLALTVRAPVAVRRGA